MKISAIRFEKKEQTTPEQALVIITLEACRMGENRFINTKVDS